MPVKVVSLLLRYHLNPAFSVLISLPCTLYNYYVCANNYCYELFCEVYKT